MGAKLYFYYSAMNAGKSTMLLQSAFNYSERGMHVVCFLPDFDNRGGAGTISSRVGLSKEAVMFSATFDFLKYMADYQARSIANSEEVKACACVLVDEAQFLKKDQVMQLSRVCDKLKIPVLCYGLRTDFLGEPFEGAKYLLAWADKLQEVKTICHCGNKAIVTARLDENGKFLLSGESVQIGGNEQYISHCRKHHPVFMTSMEEEGLPPRALKRRRSEGWPSAKPLECDQSKDKAKNETAEAATGGA